MRRLCVAGGLQCLNASIQLVALGLQVGDLIVKSRKARLEAHRDLSDSLREIRECADRLRLDAVPLAPSGQFSDLVDDIGDRVDLRHGESSKSSVDVESPKVRRGGVTDSPAAPVTPCAEGCCRVHIHLDGKTIVHAIEDHNRKRGQR